MITITETLITNDRVIRDETYEMARSAAPKYFIDQLSQYLSHIDLTEYVYSDTNEIVHLCGFLEQIQDCQHIEIHKQNPFDHIEINSDAQHVQLVHSTLHDTYNILFEVVTPGVVVLPDEEDDFPEVSFLPDDNFQVSSYTMYDDS